MQYYSSECPILSATNGISYEISVAGCHFNCKGCQNPELQDYHAGKELTEDLLESLIKDIHKFYDNHRIDNIDLIGGEPLDQSGLTKFLEKIRSEFPDLGIWIYTGYEINQIPDDLLKLSDYIKCGKYIESLRDDNGFKSEYGPTLITSNQYIVKCSDELERRNHKC